MWRGCWALVLLVACAPADPSSGSDCSSVTMPSLSTVNDRHKGELSHRQHLEALFNRYGENGSISLAGLRRLLQSLGLDRIRTVTVQHHEKPGRHHHGNHKHHHHHHHGHHNHSHTDHKQDKGQQPGSHDDHGHDDHNHDHSHDDHGHDDHGHDHNDHDDHNHDHSHDDHTHDNHTHDDHSNHDDHNDHDHDDHSHDNHNHDDHSHDDHSHDDHNHDDHNHDDHSHDDHSHDDHSHDDHSHDDHNHEDHNHEHSNEAQDQSSDMQSKKLLNEAGTKMGKDEFEKNKVPESTTASGVRRAKREEPTSSRSQNTPVQLHKGDSEQEDPALEPPQCLNASSLLSSHGLTPEGGLTPGDFILLCPSLLDQLDRGACVRHGAGAGRRHGNHSHTELSDAPAGEGRNVATAWAGGFTSITIISLLSLLGVILIPLMNKVFFNFLLSFLVALAVGTLSGDAFLHLIPHSLVAHHHSNELPHGDHGDHGDHAEHGDDSMDGVWKGLTALGGVYFMFLIEHFLTLGKMYKDKKNKTQKKAELQDKEEQAALKEDLLKNHEEVEAAVPAGVVEEEQVMLTPSVQVLSAQGYTEPDCENKCHSHFHDTVGQADHKHHHHHDYHHILHHHHSQNHHPHSHSHSHGMSRLQEGGGGIASLAWMVVMGDGLHNFSDGLAIGAAFTQGLSSGLSTSVAVFCHELPHELGDFAVLLKAGMTVKQAIWYNVLSAMMAYLGMATGILIGHYAENVSMWIFALTAGLFMYVALVDMMPEMLHNDAGEHGFSHWGFFGLQNAGILLGFCIMLLIALFEHRIHLELGQ